MPAADSNGKSDPYVKLKVNGQTKKSKVVKKNLNPHWDEEFTFDVQPQAGSDEVSIEVFDHDMVSKHDSLGSFTFNPFREGVSGHWQSFTRNLAHPKQSGEFHFQAKFC